MSPIGKFGIGFFSVFVLGNHVKVISRRFDSGAADTKVLQFFSIDRRPIVRSAASDELPVDYSTRVAIKLTHPSFASAKKEPTSQRGPSLADQLRHLVSAVDVRIEFLDSIAGSSFVHEPEWTETSAEVFLDELLSFLSVRERRDLIERHKHQLTILRADDGAVTGRAAIHVVRPERPHHETAVGFISVGGFVGGAGSVREAMHIQRAWFRSPADWAALPVQYVGVLVGSTEDISRIQFKHNVSEPSLKEWSSAQAKLIDQQKLSKFLLMRTCYDILSLGGDPGTLPFCYHKRNFVTFSEFMALALATKNLYIPISEEYDKSFDVVNSSGLGAVYYIYDPIEEFFALQFSGRNEIIDSETGRVIIAEGGTELYQFDFEEDRMPFPFKMLVDTLTRLWSAKPRFSVRKGKAFSGEVIGTPEERWLLHIARP